MIAVHPLTRLNRVSKDLAGLRIYDQLTSVIAKAQELDFEAIPLEQLKGDLARRGHPVKQALALDAEHRRIFFTDADGHHLFAEYAEADHNFEIGTIGPQASISKDYDVVELEPSDESSNLGESVTTTSEEEDAVETPGMYPGATPTVKPEENDRGFSEDEEEPTRDIESITGDLAKSARLLMRELIQAQAT